MGRNYRKLGGRHHDFRLITLETSVALRRFNILNLDVATTKNESRLRPVEPPAKEERRGCRRRPPHRRSDIYVRPGRDTKTRCTSRVELINYGGPLRVRRPLVSVTGVKRRQVGEGGGRRGASVS